MLNITKKARSNLSNFFTLLLSAFATGVFW